MDEQKEIPFRYAHGLLKVDCASKSWNDIQVRYFEKYPGPGKAYADMSSERSTLVVCLEQRGGHCEARLDLKVRSERNRYDLNGDQMEITFRANPDPLCSTI
jgi:hypothetical protein